MVTTEELVTAVKDKRRQLLQEGADRERALATSRAMWIVHQAGSREFMR